MAIFIDTHCNSYIVNNKPQAHRAMTNKPKNTPEIPVIVKLQAATMGPRDISGVFILEEVAPCQK